MTYNKPVKEIEVGMGFHYMPLYILTYLKKFTGLCVCITLSKMNE